MAVPKLISLQFEQIQTSIFKSPVQELLQKEQDEFLHNQLCLLKPRYREVLEVFMGIHPSAISLSELARVWKVSPQQVSAMKYRAFRTLRSKITAGGNDADTILP